MVWASPSSVRRRCSKRVQRPQEAYKRPFRDTIITGLSSSTDTENHYKHSLPLFSSFALAWAHTLKHAASHSQSQWLPRRLMENSIIPCLILRHSPLHIPPLLPALSYCPSNMDPLHKGQITVLMNWVVGSWAQSLMPYGRDCVHPHIHTQAEAGPVEYDGTVAAHVLVLDTSVNLVF